MKNDPFSVIPESILTYWKNKYGDYLMAYSTDEFFIFVENGRLDCFHPSGDKLARHHKSTGQTLYIWKNNVKEPLTENEYMAKLVEEQQ